MCLDPYQKRTYVPVTEEQISEVINVFHCSRELAVWRLQTFTKEYREERLKAFEALRSSAPSEEELTRCRAIRQKFKPIVIRAKGE